MAYIVLYTRLKCHPTHPSLQLHLQFTWLARFHLIWHEIHDLITRQSLLAAIRACSAVAATRRSCYTFSATPVRCAPTSHAFESGAPEAV